jgi:ribonuclease III
MANVPSAGMPGRGAEGGEPLDALEARLGLRFRDRGLLEQALTHHSVYPDEPARSYDRLEFLGDAILGERVVEHLFHAYPDANEGELTALKSEVVSRRVLAQVGRRLGLDGHVRVDAASLRTFNERTRDSLRADALEAILGAASLDQGREAAIGLIEREIVPLIPQVRASLGENNPKGALQQHVLRQTGQLPRYATLEQSGSANDRRYTVGVFVGERLLATGTGASIKEAGREAARAALRGELPETAGE